MASQYQSIDMSYLVTSLMMSRIYEEHLDGCRIYFDA